MACSLDKSAPADKHSALKWMRVLVATAAALLCNLHHHSTHHIGHPIHTLVEEGLLWLS